MAKNKDYLHDRAVLLGIAVNSFLVLAITATILFRLNADTSVGYIREYRANLGLDAYKAGSAVDILAFMVFAVITLVLSILLSKKLFHLRRDGAMIIIFMTTLILVFTLIVGHALLSLR